MDWLLILVLMLSGTLLIVVEIIFVPGTTIVGILGFMFFVYCIYLGYNYYGANTGTLILFGSAAINIIAIAIAFKSKSWERFSLKNTMKGRFNEDFQINLNVGDKGITISTLKPIGKAIFGINEIEVSSDGGYVGENVEIEVKKIEPSKIIVQSINN